MRRSAALAALALLLGVQATPALAVATKTTLHVIEQQVMCVTCQIPLEVAESPAADDERAFIVSRIDRGETVAQIKHDLVLQYGNGVLDLPPAHGFNVVFYVLPVAAALAAIALLAVLLPRWRRRNPPGPAVAGPTLDSEDAARLEADLAKFDG